MTTASELEVAHEAHNRSIPVQGGIYALAAVVAGLVAIPAVGDYLRVRTSDAIVALGPYLLVSTVATLAFKLRGVDRVYAAINHLESWSVAWVVHSLIYASGSAHSIFWAFYAAQITVLGVGYERRWHALALAAGGPALLAAALSFRGSIADAILSLLLAGIGSVIFMQLRDASDTVRQKLVTERELRADLADLEATEARERMVTPLYVDLEGRFAQVREALQRTRSDLDDPSLRGAIEALLLRIDGAQEELRVAMHLLDDKARAWPEIANGLRKRLAPLTASVEFSFVDSTSEEPAHVLPARARDLERAVLEAVRNAVRHSGARHVQVGIAAGDVLRAEVRDDGTGLPLESLDRENGGIANLRRRAALAGGRMHVSAGKEGTRLVFEVPNSLPATP